MSSLSPTLQCILCVLVCVYMDVCVYEHEWWLIQLRSQLTPSIWKKAEEKKRKKKHYIVAYV